MKHGRKGFRAGHMLQSSGCPRFGGRNELKACLDKWLPESSDEIIRRHGPLDGHADEINRLEQGRSKAPLGAAAPAADLPVRIDLARRAVDERVANIREVAQFLNRDPASLSELLLRYERPPRP